jgi:hypothetical protein
VWSPDLRAEFLALLRETGNARASARRLGHPHLFLNRWRRDPVFRRDCATAVAQADDRLREAPGPFPVTAEFAPTYDLPPIEFKSMPSGEEPPEQVIRRTSNGRTQISYVREGDVTSADEAAFLERFRSTGQFEASALAVGFHPSTFYRRIRKHPAFARDCEQARDEAEIVLEYKLVGQCHALMRRPGEDRPEGEEEVPFNPEAAMRILHFLDRRRAGRFGSKPRKGLPERSLDEAVESILAKVEAIERHEAMRKEQAEREDEESPLPAREGPGVGRRAQRDFSDSESRPPSADPPLTPPFQEGES